MVKIFKKISRLCLMVSVVSPIGMVYARVTIIPVADVTLLGGDFYYKGKRSGFGGWVDIDLVPALRFSKNSILIINYSGRYRGIQSATELIGGEDEGEKLFEQTQEHFIFMKLLQKTPFGFEIKPKVTYKLKYLKEARDDEWTKCDYDYNRLGGGIEVEKNFTTKLFSCRVIPGVTYNSTVFPNFISAAAEAGMESPEGKKLMNFNSISAYVRNSFLFKPEVRIKLKYIYTIKNYPDHYILHKDGTYEPAEKRVDNVHHGSLNLSYLIRKLPYMSKKVKTIVGLETDLKLNISNDNYIDILDPRTKETKLMEDYFDYWRVSCTPYFTVYIGPNFAVSCSGTYLKTNYKGRIVRVPHTPTGQEKPYVYKEGDPKVWKQGTSAEISISYLVWRNLSVMVRGTYYKSTSNMEYERYYAYNYETANYLFGVTYKY